VLRTVEELDVDGVELAPPNVRILGHSDPHANTAPVGKVGDRFDRLAAQAHLDRILGRGAS
jgi:hypothetical protein